MSAAAPILLADDLIAGYTDVDILHGVNVGVLPGEIVCVVGPNGAGKSTLIKVLAGLLRPRAGRIAFDGQEVAGLRPHRLAALGLGYVPQLDNVFPSMTVEENLELGAFLSRARLPQRIERIYARFPVLAERRRARAATLSGGQRQLLALGRALMGEPRLLMLDEPSAGLAPSAVEEIFAAVAEISRGGVSLLLVEQNARRALAMSDRGYVLDLGRNRFEGAGADLLHDPKVIDLYLGGGGRLQTGIGEEADGR